MEQHAKRMSLRKNGLKLVGFLVVAFLMFGAFAGASSLWYGFNSNEYRQIEVMAARADVDGLNRMLVATRSIPSKLLIIDTLGDFRDKTSLEPLVGMFSYDLPRWTMLDSEMERRPVDVRLSALEVLADFDAQQSRNAILPLLSASNQRTRLYAAGLMTCWGDPTGGDILVQITRETKDPKARAEVSDVRDVVARARNNRRTDP